MDDLVIKKDNRIVQKTVNRFTYKQNQLMAILLGKYINLNTDECIDSSISVEEIRNMLELSDGKKVYEQIRIAIKRFGESSSVGCLEKNKKGDYEYVWRPFFKEIRLNENECIFSWNELMKPYLIDLKNNYTQYLAADYLKLHSIYSQNLYEQLKSLENYEKSYKKKPQIPIDELRNVLQVNGKKAYDRWGALKQLIVDKAIKEISEVTDITVKYKPIKEGRNVIALEFTVKRKELQKPTKKKREQYKKLTGHEIPAEVTQKPDPDLLAQLQAIQKQHKENN